MFYSEKASVIALTICAARFRPLIEKRIAFAQAAVGNAVAVLPDAVNDAVEVIVRRFQEVLDCAPRRVVGMQKARFVAHLVVERRVDDIREIADVRGEIGVAPRGQRVVVGAKVQVELSTPSSAVSVFPNVY